VLENIYILKTGWRVILFFSFEVIFI